MVGYFNPLHREGGDGKTGQLGCLPYDFNPLHREGGDYIPFGGFNVSVVFQSTPPRGWRRHFRYEGRLNYVISIHSTARVETLWNSTERYGDTNFNPLHREGGDL